MKFSYTTFEDSKIDRNDLEYRLSLNLSDFSSKFIKFLENKKENITYEDLKRENLLSFKKAAQLLRLLKVEGFDNEDDEINERFLFVVLFGSETPTYEQQIKRLRFINDLSRMTIEPFRSCIFSESRLNKNVQKYIFKEEDSRMFMLVNVNHGKGLDGEDIKIAEHIYIHKLPSIIIGKWVRHLINPSISRDPPLAKLLHKYAISVIQPQYIVSNPLSVMDPVFSELQKEEFLQNIPSDSDEFKKIKENIPFNFYSNINNNRTCEQITVMFKVINIPDILDIPEDNEMDYKDCKVNVYIEGFTTYSLGTRCGETIRDIKNFLKLHPNEELAERDLYVPLADDMSITNDMNLWIIPDTRVDCKVKVYTKGSTHVLGSRCGETIRDIKNFLKLHPDEEIAEKDLYVILPDDMVITRDMNLWIPPKLPEIPQIQFSQFSQLPQAPSKSFDITSLLNPSSSLFSPTPKQFSQVPQVPSKSFDITALLNPSSDPFSAKQFSQVPSKSFDPFSAKQFSQVPNIDLSGLLQK